MAELVKLGGSFTFTAPLYRIGADTGLCREGKVKYIGICECNGDTLRRAYKVHPIAAIQVEYSPFTLDAEDAKIGVLQAARELGVTVFAYSPLGRGILTGKYVCPFKSTAKTVLL
jgi:aryl-alcohol dehydrogenase-like predicted oxidoreductase